jgi:DNA-binding HxlR family transcriptional regulator
VTKQLRTGKEIHMRAGAHGLSLLSDPLDAHVFRALEDGPLSLIALRQAAGLPPQTTLRKHLKSLTRQALLVRTQPREFPAAVTYELSAAGLELCAAAKSVESWLTTSPSGSLPLGDPTTKRAIKSLIDAWTTKMLRALVAKPLSLTELDRLLTGVDYPALERRLTAMRLAGLVEAARRSGGNTPYRVTRWLREAVGPLIITADWEGRHGMAGSEPLGRLDIETIFLLAMPLVRLPSSFDGTCHLTVDLSGGDLGSPAGVAVAVEEGRPVSCNALRGSERTSSAVGSGTTWLAVLSGSSEAPIAFEGDRHLAQALVAGLRRVCTPQPVGHLLVA